ncbi:hypothetical protein CIRMBP1310_01229 [Enterococcus cecorum]|uniref:DUF2634 domain-containing protein n=1 Tax=Enterococcus cecorum TaxID=44008 RepID=UPI000AF6D74D|nr:DUF2634 domain-containing protein [Enterococcus cecorum]MDZ5560905.1 DUF2634 domain-containing protein [Enterococcus cecorum]RBR36022.1 hypothetical protein EB26_00844 [Enterococcus cecorum]CAI3321639.1 hypothetical protein CIRMBP1296_00206 [Enterococcus cecorum]CAI3429523.1 hypothetical protein CIRMBP1310_01229 [Enterococcus cecorum]CAI3494308.1 hypothetical protein CIRMBP1311_01949 [Enterococcus cecorum]
MDDIELELDASKTYRVLNGRVVGWIDNKQALRQAIEKLLHTERYMYEIYTDEYGIELQALIGENFDLVEAEIGRIIKEALLADDRIVSVENIQATKLDSTSLLITFSVESIFGTLAFEEVVA